MGRGELSLFSLQLDSLLNEGGSSFFVLLYDFRLIGEECAWDDF